MAKSKHLLRLVFLVVAAMVVLLLGGGVLYERSGGESCARCHEIRPSVEAWASSTHRSILCKDCHGGILTADVRSHANNFHRVLQHMKGSLPQPVRLTRQRDVQRITEKCRQCHRQEFAAWRAGAHSATYSEIFLDEEHNSEELLTDDCLSCHGMHFQGAISDLVTPIDRKGPWRLKVPELADQPAIPCLTCHKLHCRGDPLAEWVYNEGPPASQQPAFAPSLAAFDRPTQVHLTVANMPMPRVLDGDRPVNMSPDRRQALCYHCHAPLPNSQAGSDDDRTPLGVHEGISCLTCHDKHSQQTRASCAGCHPARSNCGLDVETMDTTFNDPDSSRDIHTVKCDDCHPDGVPPSHSSAVSAP